MKPTFRNLVPVVAALACLASAVPAQAGPASPPIDFDYQVLTEDVYDPTVVQVAPDGRVVVAQRNGEIKVWHQDGRLVVAGKLPVDAARSCAGCAEHIDDGGGILGMILARDFTTSQRVYVWYSRAFTGDDTTNLHEWWLSTVQLTPHSKLLTKTEKVLFRAKAWWQEPEGSQAHYGGAMSWLPDGTLLLGTGEDVDPKSSGGYGPRDNTAEAGYYWNAEMTSQNPASPWGKILRFNADGSVPDGRTKGVKPNPFLGKSAVNPYIPDGTSHVIGYNPWAKPFKAKPIKYNPYTYAVGFKQPFRGVVDPASGNFIVGDVGPDAVADDPQKGSKGFEEFNTVPAGGGTNHGWPRCVADNRPYHDYDWAKQVDNGPLSCKGMTPADIWYAKDDPANWPVMGVGTITSEPVVVYGDKRSGALRLPERFDNSVIILEWSRNMILGVPLEKGRMDVDWQNWQILKPATSDLAQSAVPSADGVVRTMLNPLYGASGRDGALYLAEFGPSFGNNATSRLSRIVCAGCTPAPDDDFVQTPGVPVVTAETAFVPPAQAPLAPLKEVSMLLPAPAAAAGGGFILLLAALGWRRRGRVV
jgi:glucose/arabinose dehydrogenase